MIISKFSGLEHFYEVLVSKFRSRLQLCCLVVIGEVYRVLENRRSN